MIGDDRERSRVTQLKTAASYCISKELCHGYEHSNL